jgi:hypothetical protein
VFSLNLGLREFPLKLKELTNVHTNGDHSNLTCIIMRPSMDGSNDKIHKTTKEKTTKHFMNHGFGRFLKSDGGTTACFMIMKKNLIMQWIMGKHKNPFQDFSFLCSPLLNDIFLIYTRNIQNERQFFYDHAWILAPIFGAFLCVSTPLNSMSHAVSH